VRILSRREAKAQGSVVRLLCGVEPWAIILRNHHMQQNTRPSPEVAARMARRLRTLADPVIDISLGDPPPGRSALALLRAKPPEPPKPPFIISAARDASLGDGHVDRAPALRDREVGKRLRGAAPLRDNGATGRLEVLRPILAEMESFSNTRAADALNARGLLAANGNKWSAQRVWGLRRRLTRPNTSAHAAATQPAPARPAADGDAEPQEGPPAMMPADAPTAATHAPAAEEASHAAPTPENAPVTPTRARRRDVPAMTPGAVRMRERRANRAKARLTNVTPEARTGKAKARVQNRTPAAVTRDDGVVDVVLLSALLAQLPSAGEAWTAERRKAWFSLAAHVIGGSPP
jgi:hypothetical protein